MSQLRRTLVMVLILLAIESATARGQDPEMFYELAQSSGGYYTPWYTWQGARDIKCSGWVTTFGLPGSVGIQLTVTADNDQLFHDYDTGWKYVYIEHTFNSIDPVADVYECYFESSHGIRDVFVYSEPFNGRYFDNLNAPNEGWTRYYPDDCGHSSMITEVYMENPAPGYSTTSPPPYMVDQGRFVFSSQGPVTHNIDFFVPEDEWSAGQCSASGA